MTTPFSALDVGTIMGVRNLLDGIDSVWRVPIHDFLCCSSVIGSLNILDLPGCATFISRLGYKILGAEPPASWKAILNDESPRFLGQPLRSELFPASLPRANGGGQRDGAVPDRCLRTVVHTG